MTATNEGTWSDRFPDHRVVPVGGHTLPPLPYAYDALEPHIDAETMRVHHDVLHKKNYVDNLNKAEVSLAKARSSNQFDLVKHWEGELAFNGAGHYLHTIFWNVMSPSGGGKATGPIAAEINSYFGSFDAFKKHFSAAAEKKVQGPGWAMLVWSPRSRHLEILQVEKHQNLSQQDIIPLLVLDVWEHSYYLKYHSDRKKNISRPGGMWSTGRMSTNASAPPKKMSNGLPIKLRQFETAKKTGDWRRGSSPVAAYACYPLIRARNSALSAASLRKSPLTAEVTVALPGFFTPRAHMHKCSPSTTTITP